MREPKMLAFNAEARNKLLSGINKVADAVASTLGPKGRNVAINEAFNVKVTHDGVSVAGSINLEDYFEDMGAELIKAAAQKTSDTAGDGTTVTTVLTQAIINEALQLIQAGANPMTLKKEIEDSLAKVLEELKKLAKEVTTDEEIEHIATISAADPEKGKLVAEAIKKVGSDGVITVEAGKGSETTVEYKQGLEFDRGYATTSPYFVTDQERAEAIVENPYILITDKRLNYSKDVLPIMQKLAETGSRDLVIIAGECVEEALATLVVNKLQGNIKVLAVQAPGYGDRRIDELEDIAILTGGTAILEDSGREIESIQVAELGRASKVITDRDKTVIIGGVGTGVKKRMDTIRQQIKVANTDWDKQIKEQRLAKLAGGVAVINVGAATEVELQEKKKRFVNAVNSTKSAIAEGIVAGGEITLLKLASIMQNNVDFEASRAGGGNPSLGRNILTQALKAPFKRLVSNAGLDYAEVRENLSGKQYPLGIDVEDGHVKDLLEAGIIDPVKVTRSALENSVSIACMVMTTNTLISELPNKEEK